MDEGVVEELSDNTRLYLLDDLEHVGCMPSRIGQCSPDLCIDSGQGEPAALRFSNEVLNSLQRSIIPAPRRQGIEPNEAFFCECS